ncbi:MAG: nuclear transport factor 2 family protein [Gammaproteobacteria bacterium]|nr:nuclear transport factor 2 family protein [Gammaproteobacteria bacterium]
MSQIHRTSADAEEAFYASFRSLDADRMGSVWANTPEIYCVHPGSGLLTGRGDVMGSWMDIFSTSDPPSLEYRVLHRKTLWRNGCSSGGRRHPPKWRRWQWGCKGSGDQYLHTCGRGLEIIWTPCVITDG